MRWQAEIRRWCKIWHYSILQICRGDKFLDPAAAALMSDEELQEYHSSRKGRNLVVIYLRRLIYIADIRSVEVRMLVAAVCMYSERGMSQFYHYLAGHCCERVHASRTAVSR